MTVEPGLTAVLGQVLNEKITLSFSTGGVPAFDTSGTWSAAITVTNPISITQSVNLGILQSAGGKVAGVLLSEIGGATLDHMEGVVSGSTLVLEPFLVDSDFGELLVDSFEATLEDTDGDGFADTGDGVAGALGFEGIVKMTRISGPE